MEEKMTCPICGAKNIRRYWTGEWGVEEDYYFCERCGYFHEMAYSPYHEGIQLSHRPKQLFSQVLTLLFHFPKAAKYRFDECHF